MVQLNTGYNPKPLAPKVIIKDNTGTTRLQYDVAQIAASPVQKFDVDGDGVCEQRINLIPFSHCLYYVRDHIPYLKAGKTKSGREWKAGDDRGGGMYFVKRSYSQLKAIEDELVEIHKYVNSGIYPRIGKLHNMCTHYCAYKEPCFKDLKGEM